MSRARGWAWVALGALAVVATLAVVMYGAASSAPRDATTATAKSSSQTETQRSSVAVAEASREDSRQESVGARDPVSLPSGASSKVGSSFDVSVPDAAAREPKPCGSIEGIAFDWKGNPLVESTIVATPRAVKLVVDLNPELRTISDANGTFSLSGLPAGVWTVESRTRREIGPKKFETIRVCNVDVEVNNGTTTRVELSPPRDGCTVKGIVTQDGMPVSGATVHLFVWMRVDEWRSSSSSSKTDTEGRYEINGVPAGTGELDVTVRRDESGTSQAKYARYITIPAGGALEVDVRFVRGGVLEGTVLRASDGEVIAGVDVYAWRRRLDENDASLENGACATGSANTDEYGRFRIAGLEPGTFEIRAGQNLGTDASVVGLAGAIETSVEVRRGDTTRVTLALPRASAVEVEFIDESGSPRPGIVAFLSPSPSSTTARIGMLSCSSDERGVGRTLHVPPGRYFLDVRSNPPMYSEEFDVVLGRQSHVRVQIPRGVVVHAVGRTRDGAAVPLKHFSLHDRDHGWGSYWRSKNSSRAVSDCACTVAPGRYELIADADGFRTAEIDVVVSPNTAPTFEVVFEKDAGAK